MRAAKRLPCVQTLGGFLRSLLLRFFLYGKSYSNPCLFCRFLVVCCSVFCFAFRFGSLVLCPPLLPPLVAPPLAAPPHAPLAFPPLRGRGCQGQNLFALGFLRLGGRSIGGELPKGHPLCGGSVAVLLFFFFSRKVLAPAGGKFGSSLRQLKGSPRSAPLSLGRPLSNPSSLLCRAAPAPAAPPALKIVRLLVCFFAFVSVALASHL